MADFSSGGFRPVRTSTSTLRWRKIATAWWLSSSAIRTLGIGTSTGHMRKKIHHRDTEITQKNGDTDEYGCGTPLDQRDSIIRVRPGIARMIVEINRKGAKTQRLGAPGLSFASLRLCGESFSATATVSSFGCGFAALCSLCPL